jgi:hypothetical protein
VPKKEVHPEEEIYFCPLEDDFDTGFTAKEWWRCRDLNTKNRGIFRKLQDFT